VRDDNERLLDIIEAIERIEKYSAKGREALEDDELIQTWIVHHLEVLGEACRGLSHEFVEDHPEIPWSEIVGMRNILVHQYFGVDIDAVWSAVENNLPELKAQIQAALDA